MDFLKDLNEVQRAAVESVEGPHLIVAGAGSGKTRVLTYRLAYLIARGLANPFDLLALTFTNKAAREMKDRIRLLTGDAARDIRMGTFHSVFARILRSEAESIGFTRSYTIYDSADSTSLVTQIVKEFHLDEKRYKPRAVSQLISGAKNRMMTPEKYKELAQDDFNEKVAWIYGVYDQRCRKANAMDFGDLLMKAAELFTTREDVLKKYRQRFQFLMVDEYQDTNFVQYVITRKLAETHRNICVVGDDAQSIYGFRGANIDNILNFRKDYPDLKIFKLEQNYRSTQNIVNAANSVIARNERQIPKVVFTENDPGEPIHVIEATTDQDEARKVCDLIRTHKQVSNLFNKDFAVLYRTNAQSRAFEDGLRKSNLRYKVYGGMSFYQRKEIKDTVAYLRLAINPDDEQALRRVLNYPARGIGKTTEQHIFEFAVESGLSGWETLKRVTETGVNSRAVNAVNGFIHLIEDFRGAGQRMNAFEAASHIAKHTGILKELHADNSIEGISRWENVQELLNAAQAFVESPETADPSLENFLAEIALFTDQDGEGEDDDHVTLMTIHSAKGLEFKWVFVVGLEETLFPNSMSLESRDELEEERRLFYVAITRAEERVILTFSKSRYRYGKLQFNEPSRFLGEIDPKFMKIPGQRVVAPLPSTVERTRLKTEASATRSRNLRPVSQAVRTPAQDIVENSDLAALSAGLQVVHQKFGKGKVLSVEGTGDGRKATVFFTKSGNKVLLLKYAKLQILE